MEKEVEWFVAKDDAGNQYTIHVLQEFVDVTDSQSKQREYKGGMKRFCLDDKRNLNRVDEDTFEILASGQRIRRV